MKKLTRIFPFLIFLLLGPAFLYAGQFKVIRVSDGDTLKAQGHEIQIKVRLIGIDAPETGRKKRDPGQAYKGMGINPKIIQKYKDAWDKVMRKIQ